MKQRIARLDRLEAQRSASSRPNITGFRVVIYDPENPPEAMFRLVPDDAPGVVMLPDNGREQVPA
jgi:hypothetical protein